MTAKKYVNSFILIIYALFVFNVIFCYFNVRNFLKLGDEHGDLKRLGNYEATKSITKPVKYNLHCTEFRNYLKSDGKENKNFDFITIGDSFSNSKINCYQDYLCDKYNFKILNIPSYKRLAPIQTFYTLESAGIFKNLHAEYLILESVERSCQGRFGKDDINFRPDTYENIFKFYTEPEADKMNNFKGIFPTTMFKTNFRLIWHNIYRKFYKNRMSPEVYFTELDNNFFTNPNQENILYYYYGDLDYLKNPFDAKKINITLNNLANKLNSYDMKLIFMPCSDKFGLYYEHIKNNSTPENPFFDEMELLNKNYIYINTRKILRKLVETGEKDIYWADDTHWSWKGQQAAGDVIAEYLK